MTIIEVLISFLLGFMAGYLYAQIYQAYKESKNNKPYWILDLEKQCEDVERRCNEMRRKHGNI